MMDVAHLVVVLWRERVVASHRRRFTGRPVQPAMAWLVLGAMLALTGVSQVLLALA